jgi:hypothetical protein
MLDGVYDWLQGKTPKPIFALDFSGAKQQLATGLGNYVTQRLTALPYCTRTPDINTYDVFSATCKPYGLKPADAGKDVADALASDPTFLGNPVVTADTLKVDKNFFGNPSGTTVNLFDQPQIKHLPLYFQLGRYVPYIFGLLAAICAVIMILLTPNRWRGIRRTSFNLFWSGSILTLSVFLLGISVSRMKGSINANPSQSVPLKQFLVSLTDAVFGDVTNILLLFAISFIALGGLALLLTFYYRNSTFARKYKNRGVPLAPKEHPDKIKERYKKEFAAYVAKQQAKEQKKSAKGSIAPLESPTRVKARYKKQFAQMVDRQKKRR